MILRRGTGLILAVLVVVGLLPTRLSADTIVIGTVDNLGTVTPDALSLSNTGTVDTRGVMEFALSLFGGEDTQVLSATLTLAAAFDAAKTLDVYSYAASGVSLDAADFNRGDSLIYSEGFMPSPIPVDIVIDATADLDALMTSDATGIFAPRTPRLTSMPTCTATRENTLRSTSIEDAPSAARMPISRRRCDTVKDISE